MKIKCHIRSFRERVRERGADLATAMACVSAVPGAHPDYVEVDTDHPAYPHPKTEKPSAPVDDATAAARRAKCQDCLNSGDIGDLTGHCKLRGNRPSCTSCRVVFKTSPASRCPLNLWPA